MAKHTISSKSIIEISDYELKAYGLESADKLSSVIKKATGYSLKDGIKAISLNDDASAFVLHLHKSADVTVDIADNKLGESTTNRLFNILFYAGPIWKCLAAQPLWYRYWAFRYLESRSLDNLTLVQRLNPKDLPADFSIRAMVPVLISKGNHIDYKQPEPAIHTLNLVQTSDDDPKNLACGVIYPLVVTDTQYGFNQIVPMSYFQLLTKAADDIEPVHCPQQQPLWTM